MVTYDWRRCPYPSLQPPSERPGDTGLPRNSYETGAMSDQAPATNYGPLTSDLGPRFPGSDVDISGIFHGIGDAANQLLGGNCLLLALLGLGFGLAFKK